MLLKNAEPQNIVRGDKCSVPEVLPVDSGLQGEAC